MQSFIQAEYIWLDGAAPAQQLRSKTRIIPTNASATLELNDFPEWGYDGSSTNQATGDDSDLGLQPVRAIKNPLLPGNNYLVMCEVLNEDGTPHASNHRAELRDVLNKGADKLDAWFGFEQEYTFFHARTPLGWPEGGFPPPQGPYYCSVGANVAHGREIVQEHTDACLDAGLMIFGVNAEVMPGQWEFQMGYRGAEGESADPLTVTDHLWMSRWLLHRIAEEHNVSVSFDNKPVHGDWNGAGMHTNFSTRELRDPATGMNAIENICIAMGKKHKEHIECYGAALSERLTGDHETCSINEFRHGTADRGASIRIPRPVAQKGYGYLEDRRPGANANPYAVSARILKTIANID